MVKYTKLGIVQKRSHTHEYKIKETPTNKIRIGRDLNICHYLRLDKTVGQTLHLKLSQKLTIAGDL